MIEALKVGSEFLVNTQKVGRQIDPTVTDLEGGGFVVTWTDATGTTADPDYAIKAQVFGADGAKVGTEFLVNTSTASYQYVPTLTGLAGGGFVVTWEDVSGTLGDSSEYSIKAQLYGAAGTKIGGEFLVNTDTQYSQHGPQITDLAGGGFVVSWQGYVGTVVMYKAQIFDVSGAKVGSEFVVNTTPAGSARQSITALASGDFMVAWEDGSGTLGDASGTSIKAQMFDAGGVKVGGEFLVNTQTAEDQRFPTITGLAGGGFVVSWEDRSGTLGDTTSSIKAQIYNAAGAAVGGEFLVNTQTASLQGDPAITGLSDGGFVVTWFDYSGTLGDTSSASIKAQAYDAGGVRVGGEFLVNTQTGSGQISPSISGLPGGGFVVVWDDFSGTLGDNDSTSIKAQIFNLGEAPVPVLTITSNGGGDAASVPMRENSVAVTTMTVSNAATAPVFAITGGADAAFFTINAATGALSFKVAPDFEAPADTGANNGYAVTVTVTSGGQSDTQVLTVNVTDQDIEAGPLAITSNGGGDTAAIVRAENAVAVTSVAVSGGTAATRYAITGGADAALFSIDSVTGALRFKVAPNFEVPGDAGRNNVYDVIVQAAEGSLTDSQAIAVTVTDVINEVLVGTSRADILTGGAGNDILKGGSGMDRLSGGSGADRLYSGNDDDILIGGTGNDVLVGGNGADRLYGEDDNDILSGGTGNDLLSGGNGADRLYGDDDNDTLNGDAGNDVLVGGNGADRLLGGAGRDVLLGGDGADRFRFDVLETAANRDTIGDFTHDVDRFEIVRSVFAAFAGDAAGVLALSAFVAGTKALTADQHLIYNQANGALYYDADGVGGAAQVAIAVLSTKPMLDAGDFLLV